MSVNFDNPSTTTVRETIPVIAATETNTTHDGLIASSASIEGIEIRMLPTYIRNNRSLKIWPFPGRAHLYCITIVISDIANQLVGTMDLNAFPGIESNEYLPINKTIYYWQATNTDSQSPNQVHVMSSIIKSKEPLRDVGNVFANVKEDEGYKGLAGELSSIVAESVSFSAIADIAMRFAGIIGQYLGKVHDNPIGTIVNSFTRLHGDWDKTGIIPVKIGTRNADFSFELIVRDNKRERLSENNMVQQSPEIRFMDNNMVTI